MISWGSEIFHLMYEAGKDSIFIILAGISTVGHIASVRGCLSLPSTRSFDQVIGPPWRGTSYTLVFYFHWTCLSLEVCFTTVWVHMVWSAEWHCACCYIALFRGRVNRLLLNQRVISMASSKLTNRWETSQKS